MSVQVEKLEKDMAKLTIELSAGRFEDAMKRAFNKSKNKFNIPGFRKGKAPRTMTEKMYGEGIFYGDAVDEAINATCMKAMNESGLEIVSRPKVAIDQIGKNKPSIYTATVAVGLEVTLGEYKDIEVGKVDAAVKPEDAGAGLERVQEQSARLLTVEDRLVTDGDQTAIDFERFVDGKTFDGGKAADYPLAVGSHPFIDTFEEQLVDKNVGEEYEINVAFPEEYRAVELAGKPVVSKMTVKKIKVEELPGLDDELVRKVSEFNTLDEYRKDIETRTLERKQKEATFEDKNRVVDKVVVGTSMGISGRTVEGRINNMVQDTARRMESQGLSVGLRTKYTGITMEQVREQMKPRTLKRTQTRLVLEEVVKAENLQVSDERLDKEIAEMAVAYQMKTDELKDYMSDRGKGQMKEDIAVQEAVDFLVAEAKLV